MPADPLETAPAARRYCVVGRPIAHSRSPAIHAAFGESTGRALSYERLEVLPGGLAAAVEAFRRAGGAGLNVTVPLKEEAFTLASRRCPRAAAAGAANTLWFGPFGEIVCDNTDGTGLVRDLTVNHGVALAGARLLLLGAGGAARGVAPALLAAGPASLTVTNRTTGRAESLVAAFGHLGDLRLLPWGDAPDTPAEVIVNATSLSLSGEIPPLPTRALDAATVVYDMVYGDGSTPFLDWAGRAGARRLVDGLGMLVEQAAEAFWLWHGVHPPTAPVIAAMRRGAL